MRAVGELVCVGPGRNGRWIYVVSRVVAVQRGSDGKWPIVAGQGPHSSRVSSGTLKGVKYAESHDTKGIGHVEEAAGVYGINVRKAHHTEPPAVNTPCGPRNLASFVGEEVHGGRKEVARAWSVEGTVTSIADATAIGTSA